MKRWMTWSALALAVVALAATAPAQALIIRAARDIFPVARAGNAVRAADGAFRREALWPRRKPRYHSIQVGRKQC